MEENSFADEGVDVMKFTPCSVCGRTFRPDVLQRHMQICSQVKANSRKRSVFNSSKQRAFASDMIPTHPPSAKTSSTRSSKPPSTPSRRPTTSKQALPAQATVSNKTGDWRKKHEEFVSTIRAAREVTRALKTGGPLPPPPPPAENPDYVTCPHCMRRFNEDAAKRHIPFCKEQSIRLRKVPTKEAVDKLARRIQYKAPLPRNRTNSASSLNNPLVASMSTTPFNALAPSMPKAPHPPSGRKPESKRFSANTREPSAHRLASRTSTSGVSSGSQLSSPRYSGDIDHVTGFQSRKQTSSHKDQDARSQRNAATGVAASLSFTSEKRLTNQRLQQRHRRLRSSSCESSEMDATSLPSRGSEVDSLDMTPAPPSMPHDLNRRSKQRQLVRQSTIRSSSQQSEFSSRPITSAVKGETSFQSKYCYECGTKYPVPYAKYCCECGTKRI